MRIGGNPLRIGPFAQREQHDTPAAPDGGVGERERQGSAAANDGERGLAVWRLRHRALAHGAASESALPPLRCGHHRRALAAFADERHDFSDHRIAGKLRARCAAGVRRRCLRQRTASGRRRGYGADRSRLNLRRFSPTTLSPTRTGLRPERKSERNDVAGDAAHATQHRAFADPDKLVHGGVAADEHVVGDRDVTAEDRAVGEDDVVADVAVVTDMRIGHQEAAVADSGDPAVVLGAGADRHAFADLAVRGRWSTAWRRRGIRSIAAPCRAKRTDRSRCARRSPSRRRD